MMLKNDSIESPNKTHTIKKQIEVTDNKIKKKMKIFAASSSFLGNGSAISYAKPPVNASTVNVEVNSPRTPKSVGEYNLVVISVVITEIS